MIEGIRHIEVERSLGGDCAPAVDVLAVEEPLEIRVQWMHEGQQRIDTIAVTMRTPGNDEELAAGFLFTEGLIRDRTQIVDVWSCRSGAVRVAVDPSVSLDLSRFERHSYTSSACGACGKTSVGSLAATPTWPLPPNEPRIATSLIQALPDVLRSAQALFDATGGLHASALFDTGGRLSTLREDVGRHNALDKVIGAELLAGRMPLRERILLLSGRVSFELVQKALMAGIPIVAAIGAPSSLAVELARSNGMTLLGFVRHDRCNVYADTGRLVTRHLSRRMA